MQQSMLATWTQCLAIVLIPTERQLATLPRLYAAMGRLPFLGQSTILGATAPTMDGFDGPLHLKQLMMKRKGRIS